MSNLVPVPKKFTQDLDKLESRSGGALDPLVAEMLRAHLAARGGTKQLFAAYAESLRGQGVPEAQIEALKEVALKLEPGRLPENVRAACAWAAHLANVAPLHRSADSDLAVAEKHFSEDELGAIVEVAALAAAGNAVDLAHSYSKGRGGHF